MGELTRRSANTGQLVQSERLYTLGQLIAGVIHELNNPLTIARTNFQVLADHVGELGRLVELYRTDPVAAEAYAKQIELSALNDELPRLMSAVEEGVSRAQTLVDELRRYSRAGRPEAGLIDLKSCIQSTVRLVESSYGDRVAFLLDVEELPAILGIGGQIQQVLMNLLINACQAIEGQGDVRIAGRRDGEFVVISVTDTGAGIPPETLPRIFEPYYSTKSPTEGTGLGLPISQRIVEKHGGRLEVASVVGTGTTFTLALPLEPPDDLLEGPTPYQV